MARMNKIPLNVVIGHVNENMEKERKQFNLRRKYIMQLEYLHEDMNKSEPISLSAIVEKSLDTYHKLYTSVQKLEEEKHGRPESVKCGRCRSDC